MIFSPSFYFFFFSFFRKRMVTTLCVTMRCLLIVNTFSAVSLYLQLPRFSNKAAVCSQGHTQIVFSQRANLRRDSGVVNVSPTPPNPLGPLISDQPYHVLNRFLATLQTVNSKVLLACSACSFPGMRGTLSAEMAGSA